ncbi:hypothetical protein ACOME3_005981 [Neoechinorhynchus agilis]
MKMSNEHFTTKNCYKDHECAEILSRLLSCDLEIAERLISADVDEYFINSIFRRQYENVKFWNGKECNEYLDEMVNTVVSVAKCDAQSAREYLLLNQFSVPGAIKSIINPEQKKNTLNWLKKMKMHSVCSNNQKEIEIVLSMRKRAEDLFPDDWSTIPDYEYTEMLADINESEFVQFEQHLTSSHLSSEHLSDLSSAMEKVFRKNEIVEEDIKFVLTQYYILLNTDLENLMPFDYVHLWRFMVKSSKMFARFNICPESKKNTKGSLILRFIKQIFKNQLVNIEDFPTNPVFWIESEIIPCIFSQFGNSYVIAGNISEFIDQNLFFDILNTFVISGGLTKLLNVLTSPNFLNDATFRDLFLFTFDEILPKLLPYYIYNLIGAHNLKFITRIRSINGNDRLKMDLLEMVLMRIFKLFEMPIDEDILLETFLYDYKEYSSKYDLSEIIKAWNVRDAFDNTEPNPLRKALVKMKIYYYLIRKDKKNWITIYKEASNSIDIRDFKTPQSRVEINYLLAEIFVPPMRPGSYQV